MAMNPSTIFNFIEVLHLVVIFKKNRKLQIAVNYCKL